MKLLLHIGTEKTGTTSLQHWGALNRPALIRQGVFYSKALGQVNHRKISLWALDPDTRDEGWDSYGLTTTAQRDHLRATLPGELADEVAQARKRGCHTFVISNEHCQSRLRTATSIQRLQAMLAPLFDEITILCSLRPQIDVAVSLASTLARGYQRVDRTRFLRIRAHNAYYNYEDLHQRWATGFGDQNLRFVPFRRQPDLVEHLTQLLNLDKTTLTPPARFNEALDVRVMAMVNVIIAARETRPQDAGLATLPFDRLPCTEKLQPGLEIARRVQARFDKSNANLAARRPDVTAADLQPDWSKYEAPPNLGLLNQGAIFADPLSATLAIASQQVALAQIKQHLAEAERAIARKNLTEARKFLAQVRPLLKQIPAQGDFAQQLTRIKARLRGIETKAEAG